MILKGVVNGKHPMPPPPHNKKNMTEVMIMANLDLKIEMAGLWTENIRNNAQIEIRRKWEVMNKRENDYT